jgi:O-antigen ligase
MPTHDNREALSQFGPYAYRSNAAQYFNLLWPVSLGLWWNFERAARRGLRDSKAFGLRARHLILVCALLMAACPIISVSRVGAVVAVINLAVAAVVLWNAQGSENRGTKAGIVAAAAVVLGLSAWMSWNDLGPRFEKGEFETGLDTRNSIYDMARPMADDCPLFGTGPGTFGPLFQIYRPDTAEYWPAQLHNDWLETLITFGVFGSVLIGLALVIVLSHWFVARGIHGSSYLAVLFWAALAGCLFYARYDFPFQIYSVVFLFLVLCSALFTLSHES